MKLWTIVYLNVLGSCFLKKIMLAVPDSLYDCFRLCLSVLFGLFDVYGRMLMVI